MKAAAKKMFDETAETLRAICDGEVDAVVVRDAGIERICRLREIEPPYRAMVEQMAEGVVVLSPGGKVAYANPAFTKLAGDRAAALSSLEDLFDDADLPALRTAIDSGGRVESRLGSTPVSISAKKVPHEAGEVTCLVFTNLATHVEREKRIAALTSELTLAEQRERERLAHTLHDHLQQLIVAVRMQLSIAAPRGGETAQEAAYVRAQALLDEAQRTCRDLTVELSPPVLRQGDLAAALHWLGEQMKQKYSLEVEINCGAEAVALGEAGRLVLFMGARELLFNVVKHAGVSRADLRLRCEGAMCALEIEDRGAGVNPDDANPKRSNGFGLTRLRERVQMLGGEVSINSIFGTGTRARIELPRDGSGGR